MLKIKHIFHRRQRYGRLVRRILVAGFLVAGLGFLGWLTFVSGFFELSEIQCRVEESACDELILAELDRYRGKHILKIKREEISRGLVAADRTIEQVQVEVRLPRTLKVSLTFRRGVVQITTAILTDQALQVDGDGVILKLSVLDDDFLTLIWPEATAWPIEQPLPEFMLKAIRLSVLVDEKYGFQAPPLVESEFSLRGRIKSGQEVKFSLIEEPLNQLRALHLVLSQATIEEWGEIDLRFDNPVVR